MKHLLSMDSLRRKQQPSAASLHPNNSQQSLASAPMIAVRQSPPISYQHLVQSAGLNNLPEGAGMPFQIPHGDPNAPLPVNSNFGKGLSAQPTAAAMYTAPNDRSRPLPVPSSNASQPPPVAYNPPNIPAPPASKNRRPLPQPSQTSHPSLLSSASSSHKHSHSQSSTVTSTSLATTLYGVSLFDNGTPTFSFLTPSPQLRLMEDANEGRRAEGSSRRPPLPRIPATAPAIRNSFYETPSRHDTIASNQSQGLTSIQLSRQTTLTADVPQISLLQPPQNFDPRHASILNTPDVSKSQLVHSTSIRFGSSFVPATPQPPAVVQPQPLEQPSRKASPAPTSTLPSAEPTAVEPHTRLQPTRSRDDPSCPSTPTLSAGSSAGTTLHHPPLPIKSAARSETVTRKKKEKPALTIRTWDLDKKKKDRVIEAVDHVPVQCYEAPAGGIVVEKPAVIENTASTKAGVSTAPRQNQSNASEQSDTRLVHGSNTPSRRIQPPKTDIESGANDRGSFLPTWSGGAKDSASAGTGTGSRTEIKPRNSEEERARVLQRGPVAPIPAPAPPPPVKAADKADKSSSGVGEQLKKMRIGRRKSRSVSGWPGFDARPTGSTTNFAKANGSTTSLTATNATTNNASVPSSASRPSFSFASFGKRPTNPYYDHGDAKTPSSARSSFSNLSFSLFRPRSRSRSQSIVQQEQQQGQVPQQQYQQATVASKVDNGIVRADIFRGAAFTGDGKRESPAVAAAKAPVDFDTGLPWQQSNAAFNSQNYRRAPPPVVAGNASDGTQGTKPVSALWTKLRSKKANRI
ncbi:hypothetical protein FRC17_005114 [Serendipita sp. 399]|nr:hypothetical protein FRC17_005114 [Serendipita sp. 399]